MIMMNKIDMHISFYTFLYVFSYMYFNTLCATSGAPCITMFTLRPLAVVYNFDLSHYILIFPFQSLSFRPRPCIYFAETVEQDQPAHTCSLILLCTLRYSLISNSVSETPSYVSYITENLFWIIVSNSNAAG